MKTKKIFTTMVALLLYVCSISAQTSVTITIDASLLENPSCELNFGDVPDNKIYLHSGICTHDPETSGDDAFLNALFCANQITPFESEVWQHVVGNWGDDPQDDGVGLMTWMGGTVRSKTIIIEDYYSNPDSVDTDSSTLMPPGATAYVMGLVFRDKDGIFTGRDDLCKDIFVVELNTEEPRVMQGHDLTKPFPAVTVDKMTGVKDLSNLGQFSAWPNPFESQVQFSYFLRNASNDINIKIYNTMGQEVIELYDGLQDRGTHRWAWDGKRQDQTPTPEGIYHLVIKQGETILASEKLLLMK